MFFNDIHLNNNICIQAPKNTYTQTYTHILIYIQLNKIEFVVVVVKGTDNVSGSICSLFMFKRIKR